jgi:nucleoside-diphosphate-sugar epimerase
VKVLVAGATGAIGGPLTRRLKEAGHIVIGTTRTTQGATRLAADGVHPLVVDALDRDQLLQAVDGLSADAVIHELTSLRKPPSRHSGMTQTNKLRAVGTENLLAAAQQLGASRFVTQSIVFGYGYTDHRQQILDETAPFGRPANGKSDPHIKAMQANEHLVRQTPGIEGIALRYGIFYGGDPAMTDLLKSRKLPIPAAVNHPLPWIHIEDAAAATVAALERGRAGAAYNIVDDDTVSWGQMFTDMAKEIGAPEPRALPSWVIRMAAPYVASMILDTSMRVSNGRAKSDLGWKPEYPTHADGLKAIAGGPHARWK